MTEKQVEQKLRAAVRQRGGMALKLVSPGFDGVPDRLILMPHGRAGFVETKAPGKHMRPLQVRRKNQLEALGFQVYRVDDPQQIGGVLGVIQSP